MTPTPQQQAIFDWAESGQGNACVSACAGSGKTTTSVATTFRIPQRKPGALISQSVLFLAFNKTIAEELKRRVQPWVNASTFHAHGMRALRPMAPKSSKDWVDSRKVSKLVFAKMDRNDPDIRSVIRLVGLMKSQFPAPSAKELISHHDLDFVDERQAMQVAQSVFDQSVSDLDHIDFDDMLYLPVHYNLPFTTQDWIFVDEAQDTNGIQLEILTRVYIEGTTRLCAVGDPYQAIYGFRGANSSAMDVMAKRFSAEWFPLDVSWRCPKAVVREAQRVLSRKSGGGVEPTPEHADRQENDGLQTVTETGYYGEQEI